MTITRTIAHQAETMKGSLKRLVGRVIGSRRLRTEGRADKAKGDKGN